jgi:hypothetical protein
MRTGRRSGERTDRHDEAPPPILRRRLKMVLKFLYSENNSMHCIMLNLYTFRTRRKTLCHFPNLCRETFSLIVKYSIYVRLRLDDRHNRKIYPTSVRDIGIQIRALEVSQGPTHGFCIVIVLALRTLE